VCPVVGGTRVGCLVLGSGRETPQRWWLVTAVAVFVGVCCVGQALGLLVPVGWALLLYTSGLSTPWSVGGLTRFVLWETLS